MRLIAHTDEIALMPWPDDCFVQGGSSGLVIRKDRSTYRTAFVEVMPAGGGFIRGEGETLGHAEGAAWAQFTAQRDCPGHEYEARGYRNGAGVCKHCRRFGSKVFTPEDLGLFCHVCGVPSYWQIIGDDAYCEIHALDSSQRRVERDAKGISPSPLEELFEALADD